LGRGAIVGGHQSTARRDFAFKGHFFSLAGGGKKPGATHRGYSLGWGPPPPIFLRHFFWPFDLGAGLHCGDWGGARELEGGLSFWESGKPGSQGLFLYGGIGPGAFRDYQGLSPTKRPPHFSRPEFFSGAWLPPPKNRNLARGAANGGFGQSRKHPKFGHPPKKTAPRWWLGLHQIPFEGKAQGRMWAFFPGPGPKKKRFH